MSALFFPHLSRTSALACFVAAVVLLAPLGCAQERAAPGALLRDDYGTVFDTTAAPARIVSLNPTTTEILFALGAGDRMVGRSRWDLWPSEATKLPELGDAIRPSVERLLAARPDLVVLYASGDNKDAAAALSAAGIRVAALRVDRIADFIRAVRLLGALTRTSAVATIVVDSVTKSLEAVRASVASRSARPTVFIHVWDNPLMAIGGGSFLSELVEIAGGRNIYAERREPSLTISFEDLLQRNPYVILAGPTTAGQLRADTRWQSLPAVRAGRVLSYDTTLVARPSVRLGEAARSLADLLRTAETR